MKNLKKITNENPALDQANVISIGINMNCKKVITKSELLKKDGNWVLENGGLTFRCEDLSEFFLDTKENRRELRNSIN